MRRLIPDLMCFGGLVLLAVGVGFFDWRVALIISGSALFTLPILGRMKGGGRDADR